LLQSWIPEFGFLTHLQMIAEIGPLPAAKPVEMTKDDTGVWLVTVGPLKPNFYGYGFIVDGAAIPDPANLNVWPGTNSAWSSVFVPGPKSRALAGLSAGGLWTLSTLFQRPGAFAYYGIFSSGWFDDLRDDVVKNHSDMLSNPIINKEVRLIWITCGGPEDVAYKNNLAMVELFKKNGLNHKFIQGAGGHV
jgi:hypothetical protein